MTVTPEAPGSSPVDPPTPTETIVDSSAAMETQPTAPARQPLARSCQPSAQVIDAIGPQPHPRFIGVVSGVAVGGGSGAVERAGENGKPVTDLLA